MFRIEAKVHPVSALSEPRIEELFRLYERYYAPTSLETFRRDLSEKTHVFVLREKGSGELAGFSTVFRKKFPWNRHATFLFSGDTVIDKRYWGTRELQKAFCVFVLKSKLLSPWRPVYWMLISKGYKTYLMLSKNFASYYPRADRSTPAEIQEIMDSFYREKFGADYKAHEGLVRYDGISTAVIDGLARPQGDALRDPCVAYFLKRNPEFESGVELACLGEVRWLDFFRPLTKYFAPKPAAVRVVRRPAG